MTSTEAPSNVPSPEAEGRTDAEAFAALTTRNTVAGTSGDDDRLVTEAQEADVEVTRSVPKESIEAQQPPLALAQAFSPVLESTSPPTSQRAISPIAGVDAQVSEQDIPVPEEVASLKSMFPDFDVVILQSVLDSVHGNQERATDVLLGMSDPTYIPQEGERSEPSQTELDEQLARRLMLEEQNDLQAYGPYPGRGGYAQYQPRMSGRGGGQRGRDSQSPPIDGSERDTITEVQEHFNRIAESGKRTFTSFVTKAKAKVQEFNQSRGNASSGPSTEPSWHSWGPTNTSYERQNQSQQPQPQPQPQLHSQSQHQYFDAGPGRDTGTTDQVQGYNVDPRGSPEHTLPPHSHASSTTTASGGRSSMDRLPPPAGNVDPSKIGMLPKRQVSLLGSTPAQQEEQIKDDELEYVENPFEDLRR